jgi:hypothetical protein
MTRECNERPGVWRMGMRDLDGNDLLEPADKQEKYADYPVWGVYRVEDGRHTAEWVRRGMLLSEAIDDADRRNKEIGEGSGYHFEVYRPNPRTCTSRRAPSKPGPRKRRL